MKNCYVYEYRDDKGRVLYVGMGTNTDGYYSRARDRKLHSQVHYYEISRRTKLQVFIVKDKVGPKTARAIESTLIHLRKPELNKNVGSTRPAPFDLKTKRLDAHREWHRKTEKREIFQYVRSQLKNKDKDKAESLICRRIPYLVHECSVGFDTKWPNFILPYVEEYEWISSDVEEYEGALFDESLFKKNKKARLRRKEIIESLKDSLEDLERFEPNTSKTTFLLLKIRLKKYLEHCKFIRARNKRNNK